MRNKCVCVCKSTKKNTSIILHINVGGLLGDFVFEDDLEQIRHIESSRKVWNQTILKKSRINRIIHITSANSSLLKMPFRVIFVSLHIISNQSFCFGEISTEGSIGKQDLVRIP